MQHIERHLASSQRQRHSFSERQVLHGHKFSSQNCRKTAAIHVSRSRVQGFLVAFVAKSGLCIAASGTALWIGDPCQIIREGYLNLGALPI